MYSVEKSFTFDAAHRLMLHTGKCKFLHGHTYLVKIAVMQEGLEDNGMVLDFSNFKVVKEDVMTTFDHTTILNAKDVSLIQALGGMQLFMLDGEPTAENIARYIQGRAKELLKKEKIMVTVYETPTSAARVS